MIAGPILLVVLNGNEAFQISTVHNFLIALMLTPFVFRGSDRFALRCLLIGSAFGIPAGFIIQGTSKNTGESNSKLFGYVACGGH